MNDYFSVKIPVNAYLSSHHLVYDNAFVSLILFLLNMIMITIITLSRIWHFSGLVDLGLKVT